MPWVRIDDAFYDHEKWVTADPAEVGVWLIALAWSNRNLKDGRVPKVVLQRAGAQEETLAALVAREILTDGGDWWEHANYLEWQRSAEEIRELSKTRAEAGQRGGKAQAKPKQTPSKTQAEPQPQPQLVPPGEPPKAVPDPRVGELVSGFCDDYASEREGRAPAREWRAACGAAVKRALANGENPNDIARCLGVCAHEGKNPSTLTNVLADFHAGRERRTA